MQALLRHIEKSWMKALYIPVPAVKGYTLQVM